MKQITKTAGKIMEQIILMTGWNFVGAMKGDVCILKAGLINPDNIRVDVILEFNEGDVLLKTTAWKENFEQELVEQVIRKLKFPVTVEILEGSTMTLSHHEPLGVLEHSLKGVIKDCIIPMVDAQAEIISK